MTSIVQALRQVIPRRRPEGALLFVGDGSGWVLDEVAQQLASHLSATFGGRAMSADWIRAKVPYQTPELMEQFLEGMRKAGLDEEKTAAE